jgi:hypothetical protein
MLSFFRNNKISIYLLAVIFISINFLGLECPFGGNTLKVKVSSSVGNITGFYYTDGGASKGFTGKKIRGDVYEFNKGFEYFDSITIQAKKTYRSSILTITVFKDNKVEYENTLDECSTKNELKITWENDDSGNGGTSTTTSSDSSTDNNTDTAKTTQLSISAEIDSEFEEGAEYDENPEYIEAYEKIVIDDCAYSSSLPDQVQGVGLVPGINQLTVTWELLTDDEIIQYNIKWGTESGNYPNKDYVDSSTAVFVIQSLTSNVNYYVVVTATNSAGESDPSAEVYSAPN